MAALTIFGGVFVIVLLIGVLAVDPLISIHGWEPIRSSITSKAWRSLRQAIP